METIFIDESDEMELIADLQANPDWFKKCAKKAARTFCEPGAVNYTPAKEKPTEAPVLPEKMALHPFLEPEDETEYLRKYNNLYYINDYPLFPVQDNGAYCGFMQPATRPEGPDKARMNQLIDHGWTAWRAIIPQGVWVIDLDVKHGHDGINVFNHFLEEKGIRKGALTDIDGGSYPCTVRTGSGGLHLYFNGIAGARSLMTWTGALPGVDFLAAGHGLYTAGSRKPGGEIYKANFENLDGMKELPLEIYFFIAAHFDSVGTERAAREEAFLEDGRGNPNITPDEVFDLNWKRWQSGSKNYGSHNVMIHRSVYELKIKGWEITQVYDAAVDSTAYRHWPDPDKERQLKTIFRSVYGSTESRRIAK